MLDSLLKKVSKEEPTRYGYEGTQLAETLHDCPKEGANYGKTQEKTSGSCS